MSKYLILIIIIGGGFGYTYYKSTQAEISELNQEVATLRVARVADKQAIEQLQSTLEETTQALTTQTKRNSEIETEMNRYVDIFRRHNLEKLADAKPTLIESRINKGTKDVFDSIENVSRAISDIDN